MIRRLFPILAWLAFLIGSAVMALAWHSIAVQSFLEAIRSAP